MTKIENGKDKLPIVKITIAALILPWQLRAHLAVALALPAVIFLFLDVGSVYYKSLIFTVLNLVAYLLTFTIFAVNCHRLFLLGTEAAADRMVMTWSRREAAFMRWIVILGLPGLILTVAILMAFSMSGAPPDGIKYIFPAAYSMQLYVWCRFALILPAVAVDRAVNFSWAWNLSRGNVARLFILLGIIPWMFAIQLDQQRSFAAAAIQSVAHTILLVVEIAVLSLSYRYLTTHRRSTAA